VVEGTHEVVMTGAVQVHCAVCVLVVGHGPVWLLHALKFGVQSTAGLLNGEAVDRGIAPHEVTVLTLAGCAAYWHSVWFVCGVQLAGGVTFCQPVHTVRHWRAGELLKVCPCAVQGRFVALPHPVHGPYWHRRVAHAEQLPPVGTSVHWLGQIV